MIAAVALLAAAMLQGVDVPTRIIDQGQQSLIEDPRQEVVRTAEGWEKLWAEHSLREAPVVDFQREQVVAILLGFRTSAGYTVEIVSVSRTADGSVVRYRERRPPPDAVTAQMLTFPYCFVAVPVGAGSLRIERVQ